MATMLLPDRFPCSILSLLVFEVGSVHSWTKMWCSMGLHIGGNYSFFESAFSM